MDGLSDDSAERRPPDPARLFETIYQNHAGTVVGYLRARGVDDPEAVAHDVFLALYPQLHVLRGGAAGARTLLFSIAHARAVDHHRRQAREPVITEFDPELDTRISASAEDAAIASAADAGILDVLADLVEDQREVLSLRIVADLSLEQTAQIMGKSVGAIKQLQRRALERLRERVGEDRP